MTDSPTSQAMHLAMTELKEREARIAELEDALRRLEVAANTASYCYLEAPGRFAEARRDLCEAAEAARSVLNKEKPRA